MRRAHFVVVFLVASGIGLYYIAPSPSSLSSFPIFSSDDPCPNPLDPQPASEPLYKPICRCVGSQPLSCYRDIDAMPHRTGHSRHTRLWTLHTRLRSNFVSLPGYPTTEHCVSNAQTKLPVSQVRLSQRPATYVHHLRSRLPTCFV